ncbi:MAG: aldose 1-epimerase family protein [Sphingobacteriaceae bacterium]
MIVLENQEIRASVHPMGAELHSLYNKTFNLEYVWNGDEKFWPRHSPVLFPIVGGLKDDTFLYKGQQYNLIKHGFARDTQFEVESVSDEKASLILKSSEETLKNYPFNFLLRLIYELKGNTLTLTYEVENPSDGIIYFSIGAHPAFNVPLTAGTVYEDYYLEFEKTETADRSTLNGNLLKGSVPYLQNQSRIDLKPSLFYQDAIIFKDLKSTHISIKNNKNSHGLQYNFSGFPYMGIWAVNDAPFVCIEPWCGLPDSENHNQNIEDKEGIIGLAAGERWAKGWSLECF